MDHGEVILDAANRAGTGILITQLAPLRILHANEAAAKIIGVSEAELYTINPIDFVAPEERDLVADRLRRRLSGETLAPPDVTIVRVDGSRAKVECRIVDLVVEGRPVTAIFLNERRQSADLAADARYRQIVDAAPDGVTITRGTRFLYANRAAQALVGCTSFEELSKYSMADLLSEEDLREMHARTTEMMRGSARSFPPRDYTLSGRVLAEVRSVVIDFEGGPAVLAFLRDVTEARRTRAELERAQRLTALGTIVAGVAHEVNNPLAFASIGAELLRRFFETGHRDVDGARAALSSVVSGLDRIASLVRELRTFARSEQPMLVPVELSEVLTSALKMTASTIRRNATLDVQLGTLPVVRSGPGRLEQVFVNLLINAAQSFARDEVERNFIRVRSTQSPHEVTITIEDNGRGIRPEDLPRVFDPFFTTKPEGTGLGLAICHAIVTQHDGRIDVSSAVGRGTTVTIVLRAEEPLATSNPLTPSKPMRAARVLVVDDEPEFGRLLHEMLAPVHDVKVTTAGRHAQNLLLGEDEFDVVLCDIAMPDISGTELFETVCARRPELGGRFVFMSGGLFTEEILERIGPNRPRLEKPFRPDDLSAVIERVIGETTTAS